MTPGGLTLVTGFEPFGNWPQNTSQLIVEALERVQPSGVITAVLPTSYERSTQGMSDLIAAHRPVTILMLGMDEGTAHLRFEQVALNLDDADAADNDGDKRVRRQIIDNAPAAYWASVDLEAMALTARGLGEEVVFSRDAGGYVCNHLFFTTAHVAVTQEGTMGCGFVHLPPMIGSEERLSGLVQVVAAWLKNGTLVRKPVRLEGGVGRGRRKVR